MWLEIAGEGTEIVPDGWVSTRDHSWGVRPSVGEPPTDVEAADGGHECSVLAVWNPVLFARADGSRCAFHHYALSLAAPGFAHRVVHGGVEHSDGTRELVRDLDPVLRFDPADKRLLAGEFCFTMADGSARPMVFSPIADTGLHLGAGQYHGYERRHHGGWRGELAVDGDYFADCTTPESAARRNQFRDCMIRVEDPVGGGVGWTNCQTYVAGAWPEYGLTGVEPRL